jgi:hypothetical protein
VAPRVHHGEQFCALGIDQLLVVCLQAMDPLAGRPKYSTSGVWAASNLVYSAPRDPLFWHAPRRMSTTLKR